VSEPADPVIQLDNVRKEFGSFVAVHQANFSIERGEFFAMLGPSGCGKTTTLRMIAGFEQPTAGRVLLEGNDVTGVPPYKRNVNTVFQQYALFPHMSVVDNVAFGPRSAGKAASEARQAALDMLEVVRLGHLAGRRPVQLSGGQQQRVALARALVNYPSALLLDEPLAALDLKLREAMQIELKRIQREVGITFIFVTHDQGEALTMSDRIAVMSEGYVEQIGTPEEIFNRPESIFVAGFIGSANLLPGTVEGHDGDEVVVALEGGGRIRGRAHQDCPVGSDATVMLRPERMHIAKGEPPDGRWLAANVKDIIFHGAWAKVIAEMDDGTEVTSELDESDQRANIRPGDRVAYTWAPESSAVLAGRPARAGSTTTNVDQVQASLDGGDALAQYQREQTADDDDTAVADLAPVLAPRKIGRRAVLAGAGLAAAGGLGVWLASLGSSGGGDVAAGGDSGPLGGSGGAGVSTLGGGASEVRILNWQAYIDPTEDGAVGTIDRFNEATGITVNYLEDLNDNNEFFNKVMQPVVGTGNVLEYDIVCPTYWMAARLKKLGWLEPIPADLIPNIVNLEPQYLGLSWDRGANYHLPWQAGITGIAYNPELTGRELTSVLDLFDPELAGRVGMLTEMRDTVGLVMLAMGADVTKLDEAAMTAALDLIEENANNGQIRAFTGNEYLGSLENGDFAACVAWSGDIVQLQYNRPDIQFVIPDAGGMSWFDTMCIPKGSPNGRAVAEWMNFVYDPVQAAQLTFWVQYVSPVAGVRDELIKLGGDYAALAGSPILFPDDETRARLKVFADLPEEVDLAMTERFSGITGA
jgi:spermidine/putrescine transport system ATP-binding protein